MEMADGSAKRDWLHGRRITALAEDGARTLTAPGCTVCGGLDSTAVFAVEGIPQPIVVCRGCGLGFYSPMLDSAQIRAAYPPLYYGYEETKFRGIVELLVRLVARRHMDFLSHGLPPGARVLDVGCGRGVLLGPLADRGFEVHGIELSADAIRGVDPRADIRIAPRLGDARFEDDFFDQVIIWHVLEHIEDPAHTIAECRRILRPGGRLIVAVPNFSSLQARWSGPSWFHLDAPRHLYHFPLAALTRLLRDHGFEVRSEHHFSLRQNPFGWIQSALNRFTRLPTNGLYELMHESGSDALPPFDLSTRIMLWGALVLTAPLAIAISIVTALRKTGATVHVVASLEGDDG